MAVTLSQIRKDNIDVTVQLLKEELHVISHTRCKHKNNRLLQKRSYCDSSETEIGKNRSPTASTSHSL
jgi:hypothetical protein